MNCCHTDAHGIECGKVAHYRVGRSGWCRQHRDGAVTARRRVLQHLDAKSADITDRLDRQDRATRAHKRASASAVFGN